MEVQGTSLLQTPSEPSNDNCDASDSNSCDDIEVKGERQLFREGNLSEELQRHAWVSEEPHTSFTHQPKNGTTLRQGQSSIEPPSETSLSLLLSPTSTSQLNGSTSLPNSSCGLPWTSESNQALQEEYMGRVQLDMLMAESDSEDLPPAPIAQKTRGRRRGRKPLQIDNQFTCGFCEAISTPQWRFLNRSSLPFPFERSMFTERALQEEEKNGVRDGKFVSCNKCFLRWRRCEKKLIGEESGATKCNAFVENVAYKVGRKPKQRRVATAPETSKSSDRTKTRKSKQSGYGVRKSTKFAQQQASITDLSEPRECQQNNSRRPSMKSILADPALNTTDWAHIGSTLNGIEDSEIIRLMSCDCSNCHLIRLWLFHTTRPGSCLCNCCSTLRGVVYLWWNRPTVLTVSENTAEQNLPLGQNEKDNCHTPLINYRITSKLETHNPHSSATEGAVSYESLHQILRAQADFFAAQLRQQRDTLE